MSASSHQNGQLTLRQAPAVPLAILLNLGRDALSQDISRLYRHIALPMLEDEEHAGRGSRVLLASNMVCTIRTFGSPLTDVLIIGIVTCC